MILFKKSTFYYLVGQLLLQIIIRNWKLNNKILAVYSLSTKCLNRELDYYIHSRILK